MTAKQLMLEMVLALLLAIFAMSLDDVHATNNRDVYGMQATCLQRLPALAEMTEQPDNSALGGLSFSDESPNCLSAADLAEVDIN